MFSPHGILGDFLEEYLKEELIKARAKSVELRNEWIREEEETTHYTKELVNEKLWPLHLFCCIRRQVLGKMYEGCRKR